MSNGSSSNGFNPDRDILISLRPAGVLVHGIRIAPIAFDDLAAAESFLRHDVEVDECAAAGAALFFVTFEQAGDIFEHELEEEPVPERDDYHEAQDEPELFGGRS